MEQAALGRNSLVDVEGGLRRRSIQVPHWHLGGFVPAGNNRIDHPCDGALQTFWHSVSSTHVLSGASPNGRARVAGKGGHGMTVETSAV